MFLFEKPAILNLFLKNSLKVPMIKEDALESASAMLVNAQAPGQVEEG